MNIVVFAGNQEIKGSYMDTPLKTSFNLLRNQGVSQLDSVKIVARIGKLLEVTCLFFCGKGKYGLTIKRFNYRVLAARLESA